MGQKQGLDPGAATTARDSLTLQIAALSDIASQLTLTHTAATAPESHGIAPGEPVVAPWSLSPLLDARNRLTAAEAAASTLLQRIQSEVDAQVTASGNDPSTPAQIVSGVDAVRWWRNWVTYPRSLMEAPAALRMLRQPGVWRTGMNPSNWGIKPALEGGIALRRYTLPTAHPVIRGLYRGASNLKVQNLIDPNFMHGPGAYRPGGPPGQWADFLHSPNSKVVLNVKSVAAGVGKGFGVLGAGVGVYNIVDGVKNGDNWQIADGVIGTITSIGSLAPPPVGLVFAGVGVAYSAGRWLFGGAEGERGIDRIGDFVRDPSGAVSDGADAVVNGAKDLAEGAKKLWPFG